MIPRPPGGAAGYPGVIPIIPVFEDRSVFIGGGLGCASESSPADSETKN